MTDTRGAASSTGTGASDQDPSLTTLQRPRVWWHRHLDSEERQRVMLELAIRRQEHWGFRFAMMTTLSVIVAVMGLSADSAAVVIGAMLLAPLMTPVLATAACISMALFRKALRSFGVVALATVGSIALSYVLAAIFMNGELPGEVTSRVAPDIRDLVVALGAGTAGAYATVRKDTSSSLPGVAVAVALIPPLATVGITLEAGNPTFARGAMLLYTTNLAAIIFAGAVVFVITGFVPPKRLATTGLRSLAVSAMVLIVVVAIAIPLFQASTSAVEQSDREIEAQQIVATWLGPVEATRTPDITFEGERITVSVRSFEPPIDQTALVEAMEAEFGADRIVSTEWDQVQRAVTTTTAVPTTTIVSDEERLQAEVEIIVDDWLAEDAPPSGRRRDALTIADGVVRVDASGVGDAPSVASLIERLDAELEQTLEVQLTWLKREDVPNGEPEPTRDEVLFGPVEVEVEAWATVNEVAVEGLTIVDGQVIVKLTGPVQPDATGLVDSIDELLGTTGDVQVLFTRRLDITTTTTILRVVNTPL
ncbi:MAG: DUF389 domain-containing protein [Ilumatobacter sp.]|uniref:DUF389 domain-containing protein n=1 Tax=Ilumatobacter sp. TaxID=1967498 RepID=UPI001DAC7DEF|nr:DUF389 domain-containing protein [Ilumatobacter sp.]